MFRYDIRHQCAELDVDIHMIAYDYTAGFGYISAMVYSACQ